MLDVVGSVVGAIDVTLESPEGGEVMFVTEDGEIDGADAGGTGCVGLPLVTGAVVGTVVSA